MNIPLVDLNVSFKKFSTLCDCYVNPKDQDIRDRLTTLFSTSVHQREQVNLKWNFVTALTDDEVKNLDLSIWVYYIPPKKTGGRNISNTQSLVENITPLLQKPSKMLLCTVYRSSELPQQGFLLNEEREEWTKWVDAKNFEGIAPENPPLLFAYDLDNPNDTTNQKQVEEAIQKIVEKKLGKVMPEPEKVEELPVHPQTPPKTIKVSRWMDFVCAALSCLTVAVVAIAVRILQPKVKEMGAVGAGVVAGIVTYMTIEFFRKRKPVIEGNA